MKSSLKFFSILFFTILIVGRFNSYGQSSLPANVIATTKGSAQNMKASLSEAYEYSTYIRTADNEKQAKEYLFQLIVTLGQAKFIGSSAEETANRLHEMTKTMSKTANDKAADALSYLSKANVETARLLRISQEADSANSFNEMKNKIAPLEKSLKNLPATLDSTDQFLQQLQGEIKN